ncbi:quinoprotein [Roseivivax marinus]|uniref:Quinoprotein n=1 Tax=Roseivivax marinus TaxID=1379903 RepID=W4HK85_9RHOB|nr:PQQ-like beta-propeller repeat protein [Roseivivax marinus]ETW13139.1 quinoprotein [Roseivivax marinus]
MAHLTLSKLAALGALAVVAACSEREVILPGERVGLRDVLQTREADPAPPANRAAAAGLPGPVVNSAWGQSPASPHARTTHAALSLPLQQVWAADIGQGDVKRQRLDAAPVTDGARIYTLSSDARVSAVSTSGQVVWSRDLTPPRDASFQAQGGGLAVSGGRLYVTSGFGTLTAFDASTGNEVWTQRLLSTGTGAPSVLGDMVYVTSGDSVAWAIEAATGRVRWQTDSVPDIANVAGAPAPALTSDRVVFAFGDGALRTAFRQGGTELWSGNVAGGRNGRVLSTVTDITGDPVIDGGRVYAGNHAGRFVAFDLASGETDWSIDQGALDRPLVAGNSVWFVSDLNRLVRVNAADGSQVWSVELPGWKPSARPSRRRDASFANHGPVLAGGQIWIASTDGALRGFSPEDGRLLSRVPIEGGATSQPIVANGTLYVISTRGVLHAFR